MAALAREMTRAWRPFRLRGYVVGIVAGILAGGVGAPVVTTALVIGFALDPVTPWPEVVWGLTFALAFAVAGATALSRWLPRDFRSAAEAYVWLSDRAESQWREVFDGRAVPRTTAAMRTFVEEAAVTPQTAGAISSIWLALGDSTQARAIADQMAAATASERFERSAAIWLIDFLDGESPSLVVLEALADDVADPSARREARVTVATNRSRAEFASGRRWEPPLAAVRPELGSAPTAPFRRVVWWPAFRSLFAAGALGTLIFWLTLASGIRVL
jgi:hypothetical protein